MPRNLTPEEGKRFQLEGPIERPARISSMQFGAAAIMSDAPQDSNAVESHLHHRENSCGGKGPGSPERITGAHWRKLEVAEFLSNCS